MNQGPWSLRPAARSTRGFPFPAGKQGLGAGPSCSGFPETSLAEADYMDRVAIPAAAGAVRSMERLARALGTPAARDRADRVRRALGTIKESRASMGRPAKAAMG